MFLLPVTQKISWKNPPIIVILLVIVNCFVFFIFQSNEREKMLAAMEYYHDSGLINVEVPRYLAYLQEQGDTDVPASLDDMEEGESFLFYHRMEQDGPFMAKLKADQIIIPQDPAFSSWKEQRTEYDSLLSEVVYFHFGYRPAHGSLLTAFTYMFLHGGLFHLLGNMVFLWLVGAALELACGRIFFTTAYLVSGLSSAVLFGLVNADSMVPLIGASGAVSGIMAAYVVMFGMRKVKAFFSLGFYFNYIELKGYFLLPIFVAIELLQLYLMKGSNVAYMGHVGGFLAGGAIGVLYQKFIGIVDESAFEEPEVDEITPLMEQALDKIGQLDMDAAERLLLQVFEKDPRHQPALTHLYNIHKLDPDQPQFHASAERLLKRLCEQPDTFDQVQPVYAEYTTLCKGPPRLKAPFYLRLSQVLLTTGHLKTAEKIILALVKKKPSMPGLPTALLKLADTCKAQGLDKRWRQYRAFINKKYPSSQAATMIKSQ